MCLSKGNDLVTWEYHTYCSYVYRQQGLIGGPCTDLRLKHGHLASYSPIPKGPMTIFVRNACGTNVGDLEEAGVSHRTSIYS